MNKEKNMEETDDKSFAELFEQSFKKPSRLEPGQKVEAVIVKITDEWIFLDLGDKSEGCLDRKELLDADGNLTVAEGDRVSAYFLSSENNERLFTTRVSGGAAGNQFLEEAFHSRIPVEGVAEKEIKGGYEIKIAGSVRGFCPFSQMGLRRSDNTQEIIGKKLLFKITEYRDNGRSLVLSNRKVLEEERERIREELKKTLQKDMVLKGTVISLRPFGAFVDIGGVEALLPISEVGWSRIDDLSSVLSPGQELEVKVTDLDWEKNRVSVSLKAALPDPWLQLSRPVPGRILSHRHSSAPCPVRRVCDACARHRRPHSYFTAWPGQAHQPSARGARRRPGNRGAGNQDRYGKQAALSCLCKFRPAGAGGRRFQAVCGKAACRKIRLPRRAGRSFLKSPQGKNRKTLTPAACGCVILIAY